MASADGSAPSLGKKLHMKKILAAALVAMLSTAAPALAQTAPAPQVDAAFAEKVRATLAQHPEFIVAAMQGMEARDREQRTQLLNEKVAPVRAKMFAKGFGPFVGNPNGTAIAVEYVDYACPICKVAHQAVDAVVAKRKDVKVVIAQRLIFGPDSEKLARFALASDLQGKFPATHDALYDAFGDHHETKPTDEKLKEIATKVGLDYDRAVKDMNGPQVSKTFADQMATADQIGIAGTPFFITKDSVLAGYPGSEQALSAAIK